MRKLLIIFFFYFVNNLFAQSLKSPEEFKINQISIHKSEKKISYITFPLLITFKSYQILLGPIKGENCPMYPSCSYYGIEAVKKYKLKGLLMTTDRLHRCGHDLRFYKKIIVNENIKYLDSVKEKRE